MAPPPSDETREVLQPSLLSIPRHTGAVEETPYDQYCVSNGVRDGAGLAVINNVANIIIIFAISLNDPRQNTC